MGNCMPDFNNLSDLGAYIQEKIDNSLSKEVYQTVAENEKESILLKSGI